MKTLQNIQMTPQNSILVIVDMENEHCKPGGKKFSPFKTQVMPGVIDNIRRLLEQARDTGITTIYVQSVRTLKEPEFTVFGREQNLELGTWGVEIVEELKPNPGEIVVQKFTHDPFYRPDLDRVLRKLVADPTAYYVVVTGGGIATCVRAAVMGFHLRDYWTVVPVDCVYYGSEPDNQQALEHFSQGGYPNIFLSRLDLIEISPSTETPHQRPIPGT